MKRKIFIALFFLTIGVSILKAQTTEFTYQGRLTDGGLPASAAFDFEFRLFAVEAGGAALAAIQRPGVAVANGIFTVKLDFGANFDGGARWLEIAVKLAASPNPLTTLTPRQSLTSAPYAIRALNSTTADTSTNSLNLGSIAANQFVQTGDARLSDERNPLPNSPNYINNTTAQQASSNFNISGSGTLGGVLTANAVTSATQFNIGVNRALALGSSSVFVGRLAGASVVAGSGNTFVGESAGRFVTSAANNSFFGREAGMNSTGANNSFFGVFSGNSNTTGDDNSFFGSQSGDGNTTGAGNSFFGRRAGLSNTTANENSFFGFEAGMSNTIAGGNSFYGSNAGRANTNGLFNSFFGRSAGAANTTAQRNSFFGYTAGAANTADNNSFFGALAGLSNTTGAANSFFGESAGKDTTTGSRNTFIGRWAGTSNTTGGDNTFVGFNAGLLNTTGTKNVFIGLFAGSFDNGDNLTLVGSNAGVPNGLTLQYATAIGADAEVSSSNTVQLGRTNGFDTVFVPGLIRLNGLGLAGSTNLCRNASNLIATCSSSLRYKTDVRNFNGGLDVVRRLRPITFRWLDGGAADVGFGAEEVARVEPLLTTVNEQGETEGVKYAQITTVLVNAVREQQVQIEVQNTSIKQLQERIKQQELLIAALKSAFCGQNPAADICQQ